MLTLALDTSTGHGSIALVHGLNVLKEIRWPRGKSHSEMITTVIRDCVIGAGRSLGEIRRIAVGQGPGSFTGIRIAINAARTLSYALAVPIFVYDTHEILAAAVPMSGCEPLLTLVNAHKNLLYVSRFAPGTSNWSRTMGPEAIPFDKIRSQLSVDHLCVGDGYLEFETVFDAETKALLRRSPELADEPSAAVLGTLPERLSNPPLDWNRVQALYVRASEAEENVRNRLGTSTRG